MIWICDIWCDNGLSLSLKLLLQCNFYNILWKILIKVFLFSNFFVRFFVDISLIDFDVFYALMVFILNMSDFWFIINWSWMIWALLKKPLYISLCRQHFWGNSYKGIDVLKSTQIMNWFRDSSFRFLLVGYEEDLAFPP